jgi:hypothetical protein
MSPGADALRAARQESTREMPIHYHLDAAAGRIRTTCAGNVQLLDVIAHFDELESDPRAHGRWDVLLDLSECTSLPTSDDLRGVTSRMGALGGHVRFGRCAIVASRDALFGMIRVFSVYAEDLFGPTCVVRTAEEAEAWLDQRA